MKTTKGIFTDTSLYDTPPGYLIFAKNLLITEKLGVIQNERGFTRILQQAGKTCIGALAVQDDLILWSLSNTGISEIGTMNFAGVYTKVVNDTDLGASMNFNLGAPIKAEYYIDYKGDIIVAWIDDINTPKIINISDPSFQINDLELFPASDLSIPLVSVLQTGGSLLTGVYKIIYQYEDEDGTLSSWSAASKPVSIIQDVNTVPVDSDGVSLLWGSPPSTPTGKGIQITISNPDTNWKSVNIAAIKTINNITTIEQFSNQTIGTGNVSISYTGSEQFTVLTVEEVLIPNAVYTNAKAITQLNNKLYLADLTTADTISLQKYCMNVKLWWNSQLITTQEGGNLSAQREASGTKYSSFAHGEVYAFYIQFRDANTGLWTQGFHIPGPVKYDAAYWASQGWTTTIAPTPGGAYVSGTGSPPFQQYQLEDAGQTLLGNNGAGALYGTMGVWRNQNEVYPDLEDYDGTTDYDGNPIPGGVDYRNTSVVHHKFPTISWFRSQWAAYTSGYGVNKLDILGVLPTAEVNIGSFASRFTSYRICYAKRDIANSTVLGTSGIYFYGKGSVTSKLRPIVTNKTLRKPGELIFLGSDILAAAPGAEFIRWHGFNTQVDMQSVAPTYLRQEVRLQYNDVSATPAASTDPRVLTDAITNAATRKYLLYGPATSTANPNGFPETGSTRFRHVEFVQYLPTGGIVSAHSQTIDNTYGEACMLLWHNTTDITNPVDKTMSIVPVSSLIDIVETGAIHHTHLSSLCNLKSDVYINFYSQELVATDTEIFFGSALTNQQFVRGGDVWQGWHSIHLQGPTGDNPSGLIATPGSGFLTGEGCKGVHMLMCESPKNLNYRYADSANPQSNFYSKSSLSKYLNADYAQAYIGIMNLALPPAYLYNADYNTLNTLGINLSSYSPFDIVNTRFPTTIAASLTVGNEEAVISWKNFLASDRYTMPRNKGDIINLQGVANQKLYIHMTNGLFITKDRVALKTTAEDVTVGTGDIFDVAPYEVASTTEGYGGTRNKFGCVLTKAGYVFTDLSQGKIFVHNGDNLEEISKNGLRQFWRDNLTTLQDNPFMGTGVTISYDELFNRIICTVRNGTQFITASYSPQLESWCSYHDYNPNYMIAVRGNKLYSIVNTPAGFEIHSHNTGEYGKYYQTDTSRYPLLADIVYNKDPYQTKIFRSVNFVTQVLNPANSILGDETVDYITVNSVNKTTGRVEVEKFVNLAEIYNTNARFTESSWSFNQLRNIAFKPLTVPLQLDFYSNYQVNPAALSVNTDWYDKGRFVDNYISVRFEYSNLNNNKFLLLDQESEYRNSIRS